MIGSLSKDTLASFFVLFLTWPYNNLRKWYGYKHPSTSSASSLRYVDSIDFFDSLFLSISRTVPIGYCIWEVLLTAPSIGTELMNVSFCWSAYTVASKCIESIGECCLWVYSYFSSMLSSFYLDNKYSNSL